MIAYPNIDPVALSLGPISIHWYGIAYIMAFLTMMWLGKYRSRRAQAPLSTIEFDELSTVFIIGVVIGGRLGEVLFFHPNYYLPNPIEILKIWKGGLSFHGGMLGAIAALVIFARKNKLPAFLVLDCVAPLIPLGLFYGRIANFINAELIGRPTDVPWAMIFPYSDGLARHPSQLYQAFCEGLILFVILWFYSKTKANLDFKNPDYEPPTPHPRLIAGAKPLGAVSGMFLLGYGALRFIVEFTRTPDTFMGYYPLGLSQGQFLCLPMIAIGVYLIISASKRQIAWEKITKKPKKSKAKRK